MFRPTKRKEIKDILTWLEAFSVYALLLTSYWPTLVADLLKYQLLIIRTPQQFAGSAWLSYDHAFCHQAAVYKLTDSSNINSALFYFYLSGGSAVGQPTWPASPLAVVQQFRLRLPRSREPRNLLLHEQFAIPRTLTAAPHGAVFATRAIFWGA